MYEFDVRMGEAFSQDLNRWHVKPCAFDENMFCDSPMKKNPPKWFRKLSEKEESFVDDDD